MIVSPKRKKEKKRKNKQKTVSFVETTIIKLKLYEKGNT